MEVLPSLRRTRQRRRLYSFVPLLFVALPSLVMGGSQQQAGRQPVFPSTTSAPASLPPPGVKTTILDTAENLVLFGIRGGRRTPAPRPGDIGTLSSIPKSRSSDGVASGKSRSSRPKRKRPAGGHARTPPPPTSSSSSGMSGRSINKRIREAIDRFQVKLPGICIRVEPTPTLKLRKTFHPLGATILQLGADFDARLGVWQFRSSWEDRVIGGTISVVGRELQIAKTWRVTLDQSKIGSREDLVPAVRFRAAVDLGTLRCYARFGFRTERISPINLYDGFTLTRRLPLDGKHERIKLEVKARVALPEPEIECSTEASRMLVGLGDVEVNIEELNLLMDY